jgi:putative hemolysin
MTPRGEAIYLDIEHPIDDVLDALIASNHSRFPVCRGGMEDVIGVISAKRLLTKLVRGETAPLEGYIQPAVFVPETLSGMELLEQMKGNGAKMVFVVDEYGEVQGLITLQNVLEALVGEFTPRDPEDVWAVRRDDGSWLLDGLIPIPELKDRLGLRTVPEEHKSRYNTHGGMMMLLIGNIPRTADTVKWEGWRLEVIDLDGNRVDKVLASLVPDTRIFLAPSTEPGETPVVPTAADGKRTAP